MPHSGGADDPWIDKYGEGTRRLLILEARWSTWTLVVGSEGE